MEKWPTDGKGWWVLFMLYVLFAAVAGGLGYVMRRLDAGLPLAVGRALFEMACAGFAGVLVLLLCQAMDFSLQWTGIIVGVFGWLGGSAAMRYLEKVVVRKIGAE